MRKVPFFWCLLLISFNFFGQDKKSELDIVKEELEIFKTKILLEQKKQEYYNLVNLKNVNDSVNDPLGVGITFGIGYFTGSLENPLIGKAKIDEAGTVRVLEERKTITRIFPTITGYILPLKNVKKIKWLNKLMLGGTVGVNEGATNDGNGFAMAIGGSIGFKINKVGHFSFFRGYIYDPTVTELPLGFVNGQLAPSGYTPNAIIENKTRNARYGSIGFVFSVSL